MVEAELELVKAALDAWSRRDLEAVGGLCTEDMRLYPALAGPVEGRVYDGLDGLAAFFGDIDAMFQSFELDIADLRAVGDGRVIALGRLRAVGRGSGVTMDQEWAGLWRLRDGRVAELRTFIDHRLALAHLGTPT